MKQILNVLSLDHPIVGSMECYQFNFSDVQLIPKYVNMLGALDVMYVIEENKNKLTKKKKKKREKKKKQPRMSPDHLWVAWLSQIVRS